MIIKLIEANASSPERYARNLSAYMENADPRRLRPDAVGLDYGLTLSAYMMREPRALAPARERVLYRAALIGRQPQSWGEGVAEMERRLAKRSRRVKKPARHAVASYRAGEEPSEEQCGEVVAVLARELGCEEAAILWAAHADTDNVHLHILVITVDPATGAALPFGEGEHGRAEYKEAMQRAIARIEHAQGLQAEAGARYQVVGEKVVRKPAQPTPTRKRAPIRQEVLAFEEESGFMSFTRVAQEIAGPILDVATSWAELHCGLAPHGIGVRRSVNGGELYGGSEHVKLSNVDRRHSWTQLTKPERLGPYEEPVGVELAPHEPRITDAAKAALWLKRQDQMRAIAERVGGRVAALMAARDAALANADAELSARQADTASFDGDPRLGRDISAAWPRLRRSAASAIREAFAARIDAVRGLRHAAAGSDELDLVDLDAIGAIEVGLTAPWHAGCEAPLITRLEGFTGERAGEVVRYWSDDDRHRRGQPALVDAGAVIWVNDGSDRAVEAALLLARERFGLVVSAFGDAAYLAQCDRVAKRVGVNLEVINVREARRRARRHDAERRRARGRAVERLIGDGARQRRRAWAKAYLRATAKQPVAEADPSPPPHVREIPGHGSAPVAQAADTQVKRQPENTRAPKRAPGSVHAQIAGRDHEGIG